MAKAAPSSRTRLDRVAVVGIFLAIWEAAGQLGLEELGVPPFTAVVRSLVAQLAQPATWVAIGNTMTGWGLGFAIALIAGVSMGVVLGSFDLAFRSCRLLIEFLRPIPPVAIIPLVVLLFGLGMTMKVLMVASAAFWVVLYQTIYGVREVDPVTRESAIAFKLGTWQRFLHVVIPSALPFIATGVRLAAATAFVVTVATELVVGSTGIGFAINQSQFAGDVAGMYALVLVSGVLGLAISMLVRLVENRLLHWHPAYRLEAK